MAPSLNARPRVVAGRGSGPVVPRSARMPDLVGLTIDPDETLGRLDVTLIGAGSIGSRIAEDLARLHVGVLRIVEPARLKPESVATHPVLPSEVGGSKAVRIARRCKAISPATRVEVFEGSFQSMDGTVLGGSDVVVLATDNLSAEVDVGRWARRLGVRLLQVALHGETCVVQVRTLTNTAEGPCLACSYTASEWLSLSQENIFSCSGQEGDDVNLGRVVPTRALSSLCSLAAGMAALVVTRLALEIGPPWRDEVVEYAGYTDRTTRTPLKRNPLCPCEHTVWSVREVAGPLGSWTPRALAAEGCGPIDLDGGVAFEVGGYAYREAVACCGSVRPVGRFVREGVPGPRCPSCGRAAGPQPYLTHSLVGADRLGAAVDRSLRAFGPARPPWVAVHAPTGSILIRPEALP
jgi:molybdopterin/thiamine biosynthesis adenylyltransferase